MASIAHGLAGDHTCVVLDDSTLWCWGDNGAGELGLTTMVQALRPVQVPVPSVIDVAIGIQHTCAVTTTGDLLCWGNNSRGQVGVDPSTPKVFQPTKVPLPPVAQVAAGFEFTCAVLNGDGSLWCWGSNEYGQLGQGTVGGYSSKPLNVVLPPVTSVDLMSADVYARTASGDTHAWGFAACGSLGGLPSQEKVPTPTPIPWLTDATKLGLGDLHGCAVLSSGELRCWGCNGSGQIGNGTQETSVAHVRIFPSGIVDVDAGFRHTCALKQTGELYCWGSNGAYQLASTLGSSTTPALANGVVALSALEVLWGHGCALANGAVVCWGGNSVGQLGRGTSGDQHAVPEPPLW